MICDYTWTPEQTERATAMIKAGGAWLRYQDKSFRILVSYDSEFGTFESDPYGGETGQIQVELTEFDPLSLSEHDVEPLGPCSPRGR